MKHAAARVEEAKTAIRTVRDEARKTIKNTDGLGEDAKKRAEKDIDELTREFTDKIDSEFKTKSDEIMKL